MLLLLTLDQRGSSPRSAGRARAWPSRLFYREFELPASLMPTTFARPDRLKGFISPQSGYDRRVQPGVPGNPRSGWGGRALSSFFTRGFVMSRKWRGRNEMAAGSEPGGGAVARRRLPVSVAAVSTGVHFVCQSRAAPRGWPCLRVDQTRESLPRTPKHGDQRPGSEQPSLGGGGPAPRQLQAEVV